jgi:DNA-binding transcriptional MerR regulator
MDDAGPWTLDQLSARVAAALAVDYAGAGNGRVRDVPDGRTIRWYTTIGLVDRPAAMRGRVALYDRRHLTQLVAIKRLQADGHSLASIQRELVGATPETVQRIARLPVHPQPVHPQPAHPQPVQATQVRSRAAAPGNRPRFWTAVPAGVETQAAAAEPEPEPEPPWAPEPGAPGTGLVPAVRLAPGTTLLLPASGRTPALDEIAAIRAAAGPLLELLHRLGLDDPSRREDRQ